MRTNKAKSTKRVILVVDVDTSLLSRTRQNLQAEGFEVICMNGAQSALEIMQTGEIDVVITEIIMPVMDGIELVKAAKELTNTPVIVMSGNPIGIQFLQACASLGAADHLVKPFSSDQLREVFDRVLITS